MNYYISDLHLNHANIIEYCNRPFKDIKEMNDTIINNINMRVKERDSLYILGDVGFGTVEEMVNLLNRINGKKILVAGNHDKTYLSHKKFQDCFESVHEILEISDFGKKVVLFHYPMTSWNRSFHGSIHLYGHVHNNETRCKVRNAYNVSVEVTDYRPLKLKEILESGSTTESLGERVAIFLKKWYNSIRR